MKKNNETFSNEHKGGRVNTWRSNLIVSGYRLWHGHLRLPGAGWLLRRLLPVLPELRHYHLPVPGTRGAWVNFEDMSAWTLLNYTTGDPDPEAFYVQCIQKAIGSETVVWDVGANAGLISLQLMQGPTPPVAIVAFEPNPVPFRTLASLFEYTETVQALPLALGEKAGRLALYQDASSSLLGSLLRPDATWDAVEVEVIDGDSLCRERDVAMPDLIKIDVEGFELQVIKGLKEILETSRPIVFLEHLFLDEEQLRSVIPEGYTLYFIRNDGVLTQDWLRRRPGSNAVMLPPHRSAWLEGIPILSED